MLHRAKYQELHTCWFVTKSPFLEWNYKIILVSQRIAFKDKTKRLCSASLGQGWNKGPLVIDTSSESPANLAHNPFPQAKVFSLCVEYVWEHGGHWLTWAQGLVKHYCGVKQTAAPLSRCLRCLAWGVYWYNSGTKIWTFSLLFSFSRLNFSLSFLLWVHHCHSYIYFLSLNHLSTFTLIVSLSQQDPFDLQTTPMVRFQTSIRPSERDRFRVRLNAVMVSRW